MLVGYARTSTADQTAGLYAQQRDLKAAGCQKVFAEQTSGISPRPALSECLRFLREGDILLVTKPDRLARNTAELLRIEADLTKRSIGLVIQTMGLDTRNGSNPTARLMLTILAGVATWEREIMLERQREGIAKAKSRPQSIAMKGRPLAASYQARETEIPAGCTSVLTLRTRIENQISIWLSHDACFGVKWNTMRWLASRRNASRLAIEASTPDLPFSPRSSATSLSCATSRTTPSERCVLRLSQITCQRVRDEPVANSCSRNAT